MQHRRISVGGLGIGILALAWASGCTDTLPYETRSRRGSQPDDAAGMRVLFIGNSHVFTLRMPEVVAKLAESHADAIALRPSMQAPGGVQLAQHAQSQATLGELRSGKYDWVILQEGSNLPYGQPSYDQFRQAVETLAAAARKGNPNVRIGLYMVHAHDGAGTYETIKKYYSDAAAKVDAVVIPVADAYERIRKAYPQLKLTADGNHFNALGCYLTSCTIFAVICDRSPIGLSGDIAMLKISEADAEMLQKAAWDAAQAFQKVKPKPPGSGPSPTPPARTKPTASASK